MYLDFEDVILIIVKSLIISAIVGLLIALGIFDYNLGVIFCNFMNIPKDFAPSLMSPGMAIDFTVVLYVAEMIGLYLIVKNLKKIRLFENFLNFISLEY